MATVPLERLHTKTAVNVDDDQVKGAHEERMAADDSLPPVTIAPPNNTSLETHPAPRDLPNTLDDMDSTKRDSGLAPTASTGARESSIIAEGDAGPSPAAQSVIVKQEKDVEGLEASGALEDRSNPANSQSPTASSRVNTGEDEEYTPITTPIPTDDQLELDFMQHISFSNRGSVLLGGKKAIKDHTRKIGGRRQPSVAKISPETSDNLSGTVEMESLKVRSLYDTEYATRWENGGLAPSITSFSRENLEPNDLQTGLETYNALSRPNSGMDRSQHELAGGIEDWEDVDGKDVDRYGFIVIRKEPQNRPGTPEPRPVQRVSTVLQMVSEAPRKRRGLGRALSSARSSKSFQYRTPSRKFSGRSLRTDATSTTTRSRTPLQNLRSARNRLPGNYDRRLMEEAGDMLTLPPGLADIAEEAEGGKAAEGVKRKENSRTEKWRKMAKVIKSGPDREGMLFEFDVRNPKLIERTWKGIPDRWRATAWYSFLTASANKVDTAATDEQIIADFHRYLTQSSADDVQIDMDVPRTINSHIMFRKRYRGGQRLLFRVLHSLSLYFPITGYVQGMASLAATLLCYFDEEKCFVMLVRMWTLRGLDKLYAPGFGGLMSALEEFQKQWMNGHDVSKKLDELDIEPTAYGTRWYLTLFNYSIPFAAQLRVWDVFMLLGDSDPNLAPTEDRPFSGGFDILHAASAALIDGTREILLDSDFENSMKVLTSWIPVKDEELFMKVAKAEYKLHRMKKA